ncbi:MAG TPA: bifunctional 4-hydroxy-2-oxoglutarate aldolase/2-dehydro-3-deoxy-phosphogluconate aldolase [Thermoanaerobaculia bacterium]|nr:bifunctional 4-hydroxy-2-oxoglutarate aldolase/2-dehydro-3-deoxy-phosphogluconate aldolase [Thermoanaerobaculia bacterium]
MTRKNDLLARLQRDVIIGVVREDSSEVAIAVARAYAAGGIQNIEITLTTPDALSIIATLRTELESRGIAIAAGTVRNANDAAAARRAGAVILVSPHTDLSVIEYATEHDLFCVAGASTPTEIIRAWESGADLIKVYPAIHLGGPDYIRTIRQPIRDVPMLAGGPVALNQIEAYLDAGVIAMNLAGSLAAPDLVQSGNWQEIESRAALAMSIIRSRSPMQQTPDAPAIIH